MVVVVGKKGGVATKVAMRRVDAARVDISAALTRSFDASSLERGHQLFSSSPSTITGVSSSSSIDWGLAFLRVVVVVVVVVVVIIVVVVDVEGETTCSSMSSSSFACARA